MQHMKLVLSQCSVLLTGNSEAGDYQGLRQGICNERASSECTLLQKIRTSWEHIGY